MTMTDHRGGHEGDLTYHQRMIADAQRMVAYERALRAVIRPGDVVLDVGAGTGVLSLWAARLGAKVHAVESMPIGEVIAPMAFHHGVGDRITVHRADMRKLDIVEPVDVIISECLGRMLVDDGMLDAMVSAGKWLKPGGRIIPQDVELIIAPIELRHFAPLDTWAYPVLGLDMSPLMVFAEHQNYAASIDPSQFLAEPAVCGRWTAPAAAPEMWRVSFELTRPGRLRGIAGWFRATLAPGIELTNEPGRETHWQQLLFPIPAHQVAGGEHLRLDLWPRDPLGWRWTVDLGSETLECADGGLESDALTPVAPTPIDVAATHAEGEAAWERGDGLLAAKLFAKVAGALDPRDPEAAAVWENIGIGFHHAGLYGPALAPFMRALDAGWSSREQSLRLLVDSAFRAGLSSDGERWLHLYEAAFGPHPAGWQRGGSPA
ncbi:MAG: methyltransferase domain-containing protein [Myxococcota bacterium]